MAKPLTICIIDDEITLREVVRRYLEHDGFSVLEAENGTQALQVLRDQPVDLIVLDVMLPGLDGFAVMRALRHSGNYPALTADGGVPVIMLTARGGEADRIAGFELGVDDYVVKPFSPRELVARVKAVLRRANLTPPSSDDPPTKTLVYGVLSVDALRRLVRVGDLIPTLTAREFDLLWLLATHPQQVFTREQLLNQVWGYEFYGDESTVTVHIRRLREKIEADPSNPLYIQTVWGVGYKFEPG
ncbi:MAG: response regulator transcription factor [Armatimonadetes bacterium]|nr:response regulator transcription factor [Anaerolineae bacterium]